MDKKTFIMRDDWMTLVSSMTERQAGEFIKAIAAYRFGTEYGVMDKTVQVVLPMILSQLDEDARRYDERCRKNAENGRKGGKEKAARAYQAEPAQAQQADLEGMFQSDAMNKAMTDWIETRCQIGPYPYASITQALSLAKAAEEKHGADKCIKIINMAIAGGWKSIPWKDLDGKTDTKKKNAWSEMENNSYEWDEFEKTLLSAQQGT